MTGKPQPVPLFGRYVFFTLISALLVLTLILTGAIWLTQSLRFLELTVAGAPLLLFLKLVALSVPSLVVVVLPVALLACVLFVYSRLNDDSELIVLRAAGHSNRSVAAPGIAAGLAVAILTFLLHGWIAPAAQDEMKQLRQLARAQYSGVMIREGVFNPVDDGITVYVRQREGDGALSGILIHDDSPGQPPVTIIAEQGRLAVAENGLRVMVFDGTREQLDPKTGAVSQLEFDQYAFDLQLVAEETGARWREPSERTLPELFRPDGSPDDVANAGAFLAEAHTRLATPWLSLSFALIALACLLSGPIDRRGQGGRIMLAIVLALLVQGLVLGAGNLARRMPEAVILLYSASVLPGILATVMLTRERLGRWRKAPAAG